MNCKDVDRQFSILVPCDLKCRDGVGAVLKNICDTLEDSEAADKGLGIQLLSAFNEAYNNICIHGGPKLSDKTILVVITQTPKELIIEFHDDGEPFVPKFDEEPDYRKLRESGMGLLIMRAFVNELMYTAGPDGKTNLLRLKRVLKKNPSC